MDTRPLNCRHRLQDEGKPYPRSGCNACGKTIMTGLGRQCTFGVVTDLEFAPARLREIIDLQNEVIISLRRDVATARRMESETRLHYMEKYGEPE